MKALLIAVSLGANLVVAAIFAFRPSALPAALRGFSSVGSAKSSPATAAVTKQAVPSSAPRPGSASLWSTLQDGDLHTLVARLKAAGFPIYAIRAIVQTQLEARYGARMRELSQGDASGPFWKPTGNTGMDPKRTAEYSQLSRERSALLKELLGNYLWHDDGSLSTADSRRYGRLPQTKIDALERIDADYADLNREVRMATNGITLPEDREKLALLEREKRADLAATLTPEELAEYDMRTSQITNRLRPAMALFNPTETEFKTIYRIQQDFGSQVELGSSFELMTPEERRVFSQNRGTAQAEMETQIRAALGPERYAQYVRSNDRDFQQLSTLAERENLSADAAIQAYNLRNHVSLESNRIHDDDGLNYDQKLAALQSLAQNARSQFVTTLGPAAGNTYLKSAESWISNVERGSAVTFTSNGRSSRGLPNPNARGGPARTVVSFGSGGVGSADGPAVIGNGTVIYSSGGNGGTIIEMKGPVPPPTPTR